jgi:hypothetical protein
MRFQCESAVVALAMLAGCGSGHASGSSEAGSDVAVCPINEALAGTSYDVSKSRFAFGGTPVKTVSGSITHWTGPDGALAIFSNGEMLAILNANAPETDIAPLSGTEAMLTAYVRDYYVTMGVPPCQIASSNIVSWSGGGSGSAMGDAGETIVTGGVTLGLRRGVAGIPVQESLANAAFDVDYQTTSETFYWPEIPVDVVEAAAALQAKLADPQALAAYKAKLPKNAQGDGQVVIHHTDGSLSFDPFKAVATYDVLMSGDAGDQNPDLSFDGSGNPVTLPQ